MSDWPRYTASELSVRGALRVEDGNHGEYRPRSTEFVEHGVAYIRAADMSPRGIDFRGASKISDVAVQRITKGIGKPYDVLLSHKGTVGKVAVAPRDAPPFVCSPQDVLAIPRFGSPGRPFPRLLHEFTRLCAAAGLAQGRDGHGCL